MVTAGAGLAAADPGRRLRAVDEIGARGALAPGELEALCECLGDADKRVQRRAAETLAAVAGESQRLGALLDSALAGGDPRTRWGAAFCESVRGRPSPVAATVWIDHLASPDRDLRWAAHDLLVRHVADLGGQARASLYDAAAAGDAQRRKMALYCLRDIGGPDAAAESLARRALDAGEIEVRLAAMSAYSVLAAERGAAALLLCAYLDDRDPRVRRAAAAAIGKLGCADAAVRDALDLASRGDDPGLRRAALGALAALARDP